MLQSRSLTITLISCCVFACVNTVLARNAAPAISELSENVGQVNAELQVFSTDNIAKLRRNRRALGKAWSGHASVLSQAGVTGVAAMQVSVVDNDEIIIFDKSENNPLRAKSGRPAFGSMYTISTGKVRALNLRTNSFCAGGGWLSNGTLVSVGGNPTQGNYGASDGLDAVRLFTPCTNGKCDVYENPTRIHLTSKRWYATTARLEDGSVMIMGGMIAGGFNNAPATDNPTIEFFPPKGDGMPIYSKFLHDALNTNLFPIVWQLPSGLLFVAANEIAMLYDAKNNVERRIKGFPNNVKVNYPDSPASVLLPMTVANNWTPEALLCGGSNANSDGKAWEIDSATPASNQCVRMVLNSAGIERGWAIEYMPEARVMGDGIITPDGKVLIVNGARTGIAGYGNVKHEVGASNAKNPDYRATLYDPVGKPGQRFTTNFPSSKIERLYHSSATLIPDGRIWIGGSNPNDDVSTTTYATRYQVEMLSPPYMFLTRPSWSGLGKNILYNTRYTYTVHVPSSTKIVQAVIMDLGYSTHGVHMNNRYVELVTSWTSKTKLVVTGPQTKALYPPGYAWIFILADGVPSKGYRVMIGDGSGPPVSRAAIDNLNKHFSH